MITEQQAKELKLKSIWRDRVKLRAKGDELRIEGSKIRAEGKRLQNESNRLWVEGNKVHIKGNKMQAESERLWHEAILDLYGDIKIEWKNYNKEKKSYECHLENGEIYKP